MIEDVLKKLTDFFDLPRVRGCKNRNCSNNCGYECYLRLVVIDENGKCGAFLPREK